MRAVPTSWVFLVNFYPSVHLPLCTVLSRYEGYPARQSMYRLDSFVPITETTPNGGQGNLPTIIAFIHLSSGSSVLVDGMRCVYILYIIGRWMFMGPILAYLLHFLSDCDCVCMIELLQVRVQGFYNK
ncbi:hypothetical protein PM082_021757 [Marasmius tenuissimus]|nr:hypothetical protein PM082_021757 [Marasmius tenuissimus]